MVVPASVNAAGGDASAKAALRQLSRAALRSGLGRSLAKGPAGFARGSLHGARACRALANATGVRMAAAKAKRRAALRRAATRAMSALGRLPATRRCSPRAHSLKVPPLRKVVPDLSLPTGPFDHEQGEEAEQQIPAGKHARPHGPSGAETSIGDTIPTGASIAGVNDPLQIFSSVDVGTPPPRGYPHEPQVAKAGDVVLFAGNTYAYASVDGGASFTGFEPGTVFGTRGGARICCDMSIRYVPSINRFLWLVQYLCPPPATNCSGAVHRNRYALAVISPQQLRAGAPAFNTGWTVYDLSNTRYGVEEWFDYPDMAVGSRNLYLTWDLVGRGTANTRIPLGDLLRGGTLDIDWFEGSDIFYRVAQNPSTTGYFVKVLDASTAATYVWPDDQSRPTLVLLPHSTSPTYQYVSRTPSGQDWLDRVGNATVKGATVRGGELWIAWTGGRAFSERGAPMWPQPQVRVASYDFARGLFEILHRPAAHLDQQRTFWNSTRVYADPILATNSENEVGITFAAGGQNIQPTPVVGFLTGRATTERAVLSLAPAVAVQGDYSGITTDWPDATKFITANTFTTAGPGGIMPHWLFTRFGRGSAPAPSARSATGVRITSVNGALYDCCYTTDSGYVVHGVLDGAPGGSLVQVTYLPPGGGMTVHVATTSESGDFTDTVAPTSSGVLAVSASYAGDASHEPSSSDPFYVTVGPPPG